ncbi:DUF1656 domain-containing protein [Roseomonas aerophila]|uniref:DUF1656 domain-containing protein n=1 Tax=Teichococcus aerophilus TaxID=1224513 RepID=A0ABR7RUJ8_9PROT|nr:DUF1656 domain-containing protein [Pseudoroseomonas aerophila]MBC9209727.1 DUF1656 domain-containing protein [Pseudoroseomonas aerophila]
MIAEIDVYGIFLPALLVWAVAALPLTALLRRLLVTTGAYRHVWHAPLFDFALFVITLGGVVVLSEFVLS